MSFKNISDALLLLQRAGVHAMLEGVHGIGKTSLAYQLHGRVAALRNQADHHHENVSTIDVRELSGLAHVGKKEFGLWTCSAANLTIEELIGYPYVDKVGGRQSSRKRVGRRPGIKRLILNYLRCHNYIPPPDHDGGGIMLVDELNLGSQEVERAFMAMALEGKYLDYTLPRDIMIITSQNPAVGEYQSRRLNPPTVNRFCWIKTMVGTDEVLSYFNKRNFHPSIIECISEHGDKVLNPHQLTCEFTNEQIASSRCWEFINKIMDVATPDEIDRLGLIVFCGLLGNTVGAVYQKFAQDRGEVSIPVNEILSNYGYRKDTYKKTLATKDWPMTNIRLLVKKAVRSPTVNIGMLSSVCDQLVMRMGNIGDIVKTKYELKGGSIVDCFTDEEKGAVINMFAFLCDIPADVGGVVFVRKLIGTAYDFAVRPFIRDQIAVDWYGHFDRLNKELQEEKE